ncbi:MAG: hypothetical protein CSA24_00240 [Deltaproteobacteria bacterium]|nr:MAG: hypothetical protein CSA24_00240 [Deltaproteobacteria bacterium]
MTEVDIVIFSARPRSAEPPKREAPDEFSDPERTVRLPRFFVERPEANEPQGASSEVDQGGQRVRGAQLA